MPQKFCPVILFTLLASLLLCTGCVSSLQGFLPQASYPGIRVHQGAPPLAAPVYHVTFEDFEVTLSVPVDPDVYWGAREAKKEVKIYNSSLKDDEWRSALYRTMTMDPAQEVFFDDLSGQCRELRSRYQLDQDEYLELMVMFVQSIPYRNQNLSNPKYPIETFADKEGDCDDKSMLLAGLLSHEGYTTALFFFGPEQHMAVGVACDGQGYRDSGYAFIETTRVSLVGATPAAIEGYLPLESVPLTIPIREGSLVYTRCNETGAIHDERVRIEGALKTLGEDLALRRASIQLMKAELDANDLTMKELLSGGDHTRYNSRVAEYNSHVMDYNLELERYQAISGEYTRLTERYNYILSHQHDRKGTYIALFLSNS